MLRSIYRDSIYIRFHSVNFCDEGTRFFYTLCDDDKGCVLVGKMTVSNWKNENHNEGINSMTHQREREKCIAFLGI